MNQFILNRDQVTSTSTRDRYAYKNVKTSYSVTIKSDMEFLVGESQYSVINDYKEGDIEVTCVVVGNEDNTREIGSTWTYQISDVHRYILEYIKTIRNT